MLEEETLPFIGADSVEVDEELDDNEDARERKENVESLIRLLFNCLSQKFNTDWLSFSGSWLFLI